jgi:hypothetical protein
VPCRLKKSAAPKPRWPRHLNASHQTIGRIAQRRAVA